MLKIWFANYFVLLCFQEELFSLFEKMVLIDSATDLLAMESGGQYSGAQYEAIQPQVLHPEVFSDPWSDIYLQGAYEKRVQELEQFAQDKNYDYLSLEKGVRIQNKMDKYTLEYLISG